MDPINNFHPKIWANMTLDEVIESKKKRVELFTTITDYTDFVKDKEADAYVGLKIGNMEAVTLPASDSDINDPSKETITILFNQHKGSPFIVKNIEEAQTSVNLMKAFTKKAARAIMNAYNTLIATLLINNAQTKLKKSDTAKNIITKNDILRIAQTLDEMDAPEEGRYLLISPAVKSQMMSIDEFVSRDKIADADSLKNGLIGHILGFDVLMRKHGLKTTIDGTVSESKIENTKDTLVGYQTYAVGFGRQQDLKSMVEPKALKPGQLVNIWSVFGATTQEAKFSVTMRDN